MNSKRSPRNHRRSRLSIIAVTLLSLSVAPMLGCPGPEENNDNNGNNTTTNNTTASNNQTTEDMGGTTPDDMGGTTTNDMGGTTTNDMGGTTTNDMGGTTTNDMGMMEPSVTATAKTLDDVSTMVTVDAVYAEVGGWMVIHEDNGSGSSGDVIGNAWVDAGTTNDVQVTLNRPAADGETLYAMLHVDSPADMNYNFPNEDPPAMDSDGVVVTPFEVTVTDGTPAVRLIIDGANTTTAFYRFEGAFPEAYDSVIGDVSADNPTLTLRQNWRYEIENNALSNSHPFELIDSGSDATPGTDTVRFSQNDTNTEDFTDPNNTVDWQEDGNSVFFTYSGTLAGSMDAYRCGVHTGSMRGAVESFMP